MTATIKRPERGERTMPLRELTGATATPIATVSANLMPSEVLARRRLTWLKSRLAFAVVATVALTGLGYGLVRQQTSATDDDLRSVQAQSATLTERVGSFDNLLALQSQVTRVRGQLATVMTTDLQWSRLLGALNAAAPAGLVVTGVDGALADTDGATGPSAVDPAATLAGGATVVGTLTVSGTARDYRSVAAYVDRLAKVRGLVLVDPGNVTAADGRASFTLSMSLTKAVLGGRFTHGGK